MKSLLENIIAICEKQTDLQQLLFSILGEEKKAVIASDLNELNRTTREKEILILKVQELEKQRMSLMEELGQYTGKVRSDFSLRRLCQVTEEPYSSCLEKCRLKLVSLSEKIREVNESNKILMSQSIKILRNSLTLLNNLMNSNSIYYPTGEMKNKGQSGRVFSGEF